MSAVTYFVKDEDRECVIFEHAIKKVVVFSDSNRVDVEYIDGSTDTFRDNAARDLKNQISPAYT